VHLQPPLAAEQAFAPAASSVSAARRFVTDCLEQWDLEPVVWTSQLLLSELATNAVLHAGGSGFTVGVEVLPDGGVRLTIADDSPRPPRVRDYGTGATTGRGVALVAELARRWGVEPRAVGKAVWCEVVPEQPRLRLVQDDDGADDASLDLDSFLGPEDADGPTVRVHSDVAAAA
jgi:anti-sigma regulatory factor (Ser/Thr protein kinase)